MSAKYGPAHQAERKRWTPTVEAGQAWCSEPICVTEQNGGNRWIPPGTRWHLSHDPTGTYYIGPSHARCNEAENARRNNPKRAQANRRRWAL